MDILQTLFGQGADPKDLTVLHVCMRTIIIFFAALLIIRLGGKRFLAQRSGFDVLVGFILASTLSRAINGSALLLPTIAVGVLVIVLHRLLGKAAYHSDALSNLIKGCPEHVIKNGKIDREAMARNDLTEGDLIEDVRLQALIDDLARVRDARIERSGEISVIPEQSR